MTKYVLIFAYTPLHLRFVETLESVFINRGYTPVRIYSDSSLKKLQLFFLGRFLLFFRNNVSILLPHPEQLLANFFFYSPRVKERFLYEDGLMNYIRTELPVASLRKSKLRRWIAILLLYRFVVTKGQLSGCSQ